MLKSRIRKHFMPETMPWKLHAINGTHEKAYQMLPEYCKGLIESNPGTVTTLEIDEDRKSCRIFLCFGASADGFMHCRPILDLDGTHLKQKYQGILLTATAVDT